MLQTYGFNAIKLKGGVFVPDEEIETIFALARRLSRRAAATRPQHGLERRDVDHKSDTRSTGVLEYLEDPTPGIEGMSRVAREVSMPLATNMCVVGFEDIPPAVRAAGGRGHSLRPSLLGRTSEGPEPGGDL